MPRLPQISGRSLIRLLVSLGYEVVRQKGSHVRVRKRNELGEHNLTVPDHDVPRIGAAGMEETTILYRPVGAKELSLIAETAYRAFPPRLPGQPIFYPVLNEGYATQIARDWNAKNSESQVGYVTRFAVKTSYLSQFTIQKVGGAPHLEYWIPAEQLSEFNQNIVGKIEVISEFRGK